MKIKLMSVTFVLFIISSLGGYGYAETSSVTANNQFAFELYSHYTSADGNIFFHPIVSLVPWQ